MVFTAPKIRAPLCFFAFPVGAISARRHIGMFPGDVFRLSGSILLRHFPMPWWPPPSPSAGGGDRDHWGGGGDTAVLEEGFGWHGVAGEPAETLAPLPFLPLCRPSWLVSGRQLPPFPAPAMPDPSPGAKFVPRAAGSQMGDTRVGFSASGETSLLFPQVNFRGSRSSPGCWAERTRSEKQLLVVVGVLGTVLAACLLGLIFQYRARKSSHRAGVLCP